MRGFRTLTVLLFFMLLASGCANLQVSYSVLRYFSTHGAEFRQSQIGIAVFNKSNEWIADWDFWLREIDRGYQEFLRCSSLDNQKFTQELKSTPVIIIPRQRGSYHEGAFTNLNNIFIPLDEGEHVFAAMRHELIHAHLYLSGRRILGDPRHRDSLFKKCETS